jgi:hypothetical protein
MGKRPIEKSQSCEITDSASGNTLDGAVNQIAPKKP